MNTFRAILEKKIVIFLLQFFIFSSILWVTHYQYAIEFDSGILEIRKRVIQFLANYIFYESVSANIFIYSCWILISLVPILVYFDYKRAYSVNLITFFIPNFFFYVFLSRYSPTYFNLKFSELITQTLILGITIVAFTISSCLILSKIKKEVMRKRKELKPISMQVETICPYCGTHFQSTPKYCYNCSKEIVHEANQDE